MAQAQRQIQLLRSSSIYSNKAAAKGALVGLSNRKDGELVLARYNSGVYQLKSDHTQTITAAAYAELTSEQQALYEAVVKSLIGIYHDSPSLPSGTSAGWTYIEDSSDIESILDHLDYTLSKADGKVLTSLSQDNGYCRIHARVS